MSAPGAGGSPRAPVRIRTVPLWRMRLAAEGPRYLLCTAAVAGLLASARFALAPPVAVPARSERPAGMVDDRGAEGYAVLFARRYLTWNAAEPQNGEASLSSFLGPGVEHGLGPALEPRGRQSVGWAEVVQAREPLPGDHVYTVAAQTSLGLQYLAVGVARTSAGRLTVTGYPAFVGPPASEPAEAQPGRREVTEPALATVITRALRNYLAGSRAELAADLSQGARVSLPAAGLTLIAVEQLDWSSGGRSVVVLAQAQDRRGTRYTLDYELDVERTQGRWEVSAVEMDPDA